MRKSKADMRSFFVLECRVAVLLALSLTSYDWS